MQIIINVVDNAMKFSHASTNKEILFSYEQTENSKVFSIRDYGPGIPLKQRDKVFELFYRGEDELTRKSTGTGIGLALVKNLADQMGAKVNFIFPEKGTKFQLIFIEDEIRND